MNSAERTRHLCKERGIPISRLERELNFANGYIGQLKKDLPPERLRKVAEYLQVSEDFLLKGEEKGKEVYYLDDTTREIVDFLHTHPDYKGLFDSSRKLCPEDAIAVKRIIDRTSEE